MMRRDDLVASVTVALLTYGVLSLATVVPGPFVMSDEFSYAFRAKFGWNAFAGEPGMLSGPLPNLLYFAVFRWTHVFGDRFLDMARLLNVVFIGATALPLYAMCRRFTGVATASVLTLLVCIGPNSSYSAYFMPEPMYIFGFWLVVLAFVRFVELSTIARLASMAMLLAALTLVKPHAIVLSACFGGLVPAVAFCAPNGSAIRRRLPVALLAFAAVYYVTWTCLTFVLTGHFLFDPVGSYYGGFLQQSVAAGMTAEAMTMAGIMGRHAVVVIMLYGIPIALAVNVVASVHRDRTYDRDRVSALVAVAGFVVLGALMLMAVKFSADIVPMGGDQSAERLHGRYYSFVFPLFVMSGAAASLNARRGVPSKALVVVLAALVVVSAVTIVRRLVPQAMVDFPEGVALTAQPWLVWVTLAGNLIALACALRRPTYTWQAYLACFAVVSIVTRLHLWREQSRFPPTDEDRAGQVMREMLAGDERDAVVMFAKEYDARPYRLAFYLMSRAKFITTQAARVDCAAIPASAMVIATLDPIAVECNFVRIAHVNGIELFRRGRPASDGLFEGDSDAVEVWLNRAHRDAFSTWGFHAAETWGSWTATANAGVVLPEAVSGCVDLVVKGAAFGPNVGRTITARLGEEETSIALGANIGTVTARYVLRQPARTVQFSGMIPISPGEAGVSNDGRRLGIGLVAVGVRACQTAGGR